MPVHPVRENYFTRGIGRESSWHPLRGLMFGYQRHAGIDLGDRSTGTGASQGEGVDEGGDLHCADALNVS